MSVVGGTIRIVCIGFHDIQYIVFCSINFFRFFLVILCQIERECDYFNTMCSEVVPYMYACVHTRTPKQDISTEIEVILAILRFI